MISDKELRAILKGRGIEIGKIQHGSFMGGNAWIKTSTLRMGSKVFKAGDMVTWHDNDYNEDFIIKIGSFMIFGEPLSDMDFSVDILPGTTRKIDPDSGRIKMVGGLGRIPVSAIEPMTVSLRALKGYIQG